MLEKISILCDKQVCLGRGERARCYLDIYRFCPYYSKEHKYTDADLEFLRKNFERGLLTDDNRKDRRE